MNSFSFSNENKGKRKDNADLQGKKGIIKFSIDMILLEKIGKSCTRVANLEEIIISR